MKADNKKSNKNFINSEKFDSFKLIKVDNLTPKAFNKKVCSINNRINKKSKMKESLILKYFIIPK